jgi:hypothetical protein
LVNFAAVKIFLTFDYELFFGADTGSVEKCMLAPTAELMRIAGEKAKLIFFVDVGFLVKSDELKEQFPKVAEDLDIVRAQIKEIVARGHDVQLHVHPHWERSAFDGQKWVIHSDGSYRLDDFSDDDIRSIMKRYKSYLDELVGYKTTAFRAGGWCIQPFSRLRDAFSELGLKYDSSVIPGMSYESTHYRFDFSTVSNRDAYRFDKDVCVEIPNGEFIEYPISSRIYAPFFYWKLYVLGRLFPLDHKMVGDGNFIPQPGRKRRGLTSWTRHHVSFDGFYAAELTRSLNEFTSAGRKEMVIIGHPKGMTKFSFAQFSHFVDQLVPEHSTHTFKELT